MLDAREILPDRPRPLRRAEYDRLVRDGVFEGERVELLDGLLVEMSPQGADHSDVVSRLTMMLVPLVAGRAIVRVQSPLAVSDQSEPEPDVALVQPGEYRHALPSAALLVVEVADTSLRKDLGVKAALYAAAQVPEYWVVDLEARVVHVHSEPANDRYQRVVPRRLGDEIALQTLPDAVVKVRDLLGA